MDMDMEFDIPLPEELEWLEANSHVQDDYEDPEPRDFFPWEEEEEEEEELKLQQEPHLPKPTVPKSFKLNTDSVKSPSSSATCPPPDPQIIGQKRIFLDGQKTQMFAGVVPSTGKKIRTNDHYSGTEIDEEWLRYSPPPKCGFSQIAEAVSVQVKKVVSRYASEIDGEYVPVTGPSGDRVYAKLSRFEGESVVAKRLDGLTQSTSLISEPIDVLLQKVEQDSLMKALEASSNGYCDVVIPEASVRNSQLWVNKYAPNSFTELLSDEQTNREVLLWLKQWDSRVFGSEIRTTSDDVLSALRRHSSNSQHKKLWDADFSWKKKKTIPGSTNKSFGQSFNLETERSYSKGIQEFWNKKSRSCSTPEQKILLLCGPPGLGKTTLAHVAAKHCGYHVVEMNASDDRSSSTVESKILDVVEMNSLFSDSKPKCLVIDEIDGALSDGKGAVEVLLKMLSSERGVDIQKTNVIMGDQSRKASKKKHKTASLSRPVICICNDLYAPALRRLRQVAKVHVFSQPTLSRVVNRLKFICHKEDLKVSSAALTTLADYTGCDIRSCLNTLHFLNKKNESLDVMNIGSQVVGRKDMTHNIFDIWNGIFQKRTIKQEKSDSRMCDSASASKFNFLHSLVSNVGEYDLIYDGVHENFLKLHYLDPVMNKTVNCLDNLVVSDLVSRYIMRTQQMSLYAYQPMTAISVHSLIAQVEKPYIEWPKSFHRCRSMLMEKIEILKSWYCKIRPDILRHLSVRSFVEDLVSPLLHILSPPFFRPVAYHMLSENEKINLSNLVNLMVSYSITYTNVKSNPPPSNQINVMAKDSWVLSFDPPIADFVHFKDYNSGHPALESAMKQILVHEVQKQKILQQCIGRGNATDGNINLTQPKPTANTSNLNSNETPTVNQKLQSSTDAKKPRGSYDFFQSFRKQGSKGSENCEVSTPNSVIPRRVSHPFLYKFNEGFSNAAKRPARMRDLFL